jgi:hypothetical protein
MLIFHDFSPVFYLDGIMKGRKIYLPALNKRFLLEKTTYRQP